MTSGIYVIKNLSNSKVYVGSSKNLETRWKIHKLRLTKNKHENQYLQNSWNKYGENCFQFELIEEVVIQELLHKVEKMWIDFFNSTSDQFGYNIQKVPGRGRLGIKMLEVTKQKLSKLNSKENHPQWGTHLKEETKQKLRDAQTGKHKPNAGKTKTVILNSPTGEKVCVTNLRKFCRDNNFSASAFWDMLKERKPKYLGWTLFK